MTAIQRQQTKKSWSGLAGEPSASLITTLFGLIVFYLSAQTSESKVWLDAANLFGPLLLGLAAGWTGYRLVHRSPEAVWTPYAWFLAAIVLFYALGPLIYPLADPFTLERVNTLFPITPAELLRTNLLNAVGALTMLLGFRLVRILWLGLRLKSGNGSATSAVNPKTIALLFLIIGGAMEYFLILPHYFGHLSFTLPGVVFKLGHLYLLGLMVLAYVVAHGDRAWRIPLAALLVVKVSVSFLLFSKHQLILALVLPVLGSFLGNRRTSRLIAWALLVVLVYFSLQNAVHYGRNEILTNTGTISQATLSERAKILRTWFNEGMPALHSEQSAAEWGWARLNYAHVQAFAMDHYDKGLPGQTLRYAGIVLIPRFLWPDKPIISSMGMDFYELVTGQRGTSSLGLGIFGEGYWNFGWAGVVGLGLATGAIFAILSDLALWWIRRPAFEYLPSIFIGIEMGVLGTTKLFVFMIGNVGFYVAYALLVSSLLRIVAARKRSSLRRSLVSSKISR